MKRCIALLAVAGLALNCAHGGPLPPPAVTAADVSATAQPPAKVEEFPSEIPPGQVWQPGYWIRQGGEWTWVAGQWLTGRPGRDWAPAHWMQLPDGSWRLAPGAWSTAS